MPAAADIVVIEGVTGGAVVLIGGAFPQGSTGELPVLIAIIPGGLVFWWLRLRHGEKLTAPIQLLLAIAIGKEAVGADALKTFRQSV